MGFSNQFQENCCQIFLRRFQRYLEPSGAWKMFFAILLALLVVVEATGIIVKNPAGTFFFNGGKINRKVSIMDYKPESKSIGCGQLAIKITGRQIGF